MGIFERLEATPVSDWLIESAYAYPAMLSCHGIGMSIVIGILFIMNLRLLGFFTGISLEVFRSLMKLAWFGFLINFISGCVLFVQKASSFVEMWVFLIKIAGVFLATLIAVFIQKQLLEGAEGRGPDESIAIRLKILAITSFLLWSVVIVTGRIVGYMMQ